MRFLRIAGVHYSFARKIPYEINPLLKTFPYQDQMRGIFSHFFNYGDSLTDALGQHGYDAAEILYDVEHLQKKWAEENGFKFSQENWQVEILVAQIQKFKPEILYLHNVFDLPLSLIKNRKQFFPFLRQLIVFRGYPEINRPLFELLASADVLLVGSPVLERICRRHRLQPYLFHHYFDPRILPQINPGPNEHFLTFLGTSGFGYGWNHQPRFHYLLQLLKATNIQCWLEESQSVPSRWKEAVKKNGEIFLSYLPVKHLQKLNENCSLPSSVRKLAFNGLARKTSSQNGIVEFPTSSLRSLFPSQCFGPLFGLEMYGTLSASRITFNKHTFAASDTVDNIRLFEATGVGTCLLTDSGSNLSSLFEPDREVVTYSSVDECLEKIEYLSKNQEARKQIAAKGQKRTLRDHTAVSRAGQLHEIIQQKTGR